MKENTVNLLPLVHRQDISSPEALLQQALPDVIATIPNATCGQVYRLARGGMVVWYSLDGDAVPGRYYPMEANSPYEKTAHTGEVTIDEQYNLLIAPLRGQNETIFGLLTVEFTSAPSDEDIHTITEVSAHLSSILYAKQLETLLLQQVALISQFNKAESLEEVAKIFAQNSTIKSQFVSISIFNYDDNQQLIGATAVVTANRQDTFQVDDPIGVSNEYLDLVHGSLREHGYFLVSDVDADDRLNSAGRDWLQSRRIKSVYSLPLYLQGSLYGFISIIDTSNAIAPTPLEQQIYQNISEQAASIIEKRQLLEQTESSLRETQLLYDLVGDLMKTQSLSEILEVMYQYVGEGTRNVTMSELLYDENDMIRDIRIRYIIRNGKAHAIDVPWGTDYAYDELTNATGHMERIGDNLEVLENYEEHSENLMMLKRLMAQGVYSSFAIPIFKDGKRKQQITLAWESPRKFDERLMQLMRTAKSQIALVLRNQELISESQTIARESQEQSRILTLLNDLIHRANATQDEVILLQDTAEVLQEATGFNHVGIGLIESSGAINHIVAEFPKDGSIGTQVEARGGGIPELLMKTRKTLQILDIENDETLLPQSRASLASLGVKSAIFIPMFDLDGNLLGTVGLDSYQKQDSFPHQIIDGAETIVSQISVNLQKLRLLKSSQEQAQQVQQIAEFGQAMQASLQLQEILETALTYSRRIMNGDYISIMIYDRAIDGLRVSASYWNDESNVVLPGTLIERENNTIAQKAWTNRQLVQVDDLQSDWVWKHPFDQTLHSMLVAPLIAGGVLRGIFEVGQIQEHAFSETDVAAFRQITNQLAVAIDNSETYSQSQRLARNKSLANDIIANLQQQMDVTSILTVTAQELGKALGAKRARIRLGLDEKGGSQ